MRELCITDLKWVAFKWKEIRNAQKEADAANAKWKRLNDEITEYLDAKGITDVVQVADIKNQSLALNDALGTGNWHSRNAERHIADVQLFLKLHETGLFTEMRERL